MSAILCDLTSDFIDVIYTCRISELIKSRQTPEQVKIQLQTKVVNLSSILVEHCLFLIHLKQIYSK